MGCTRFLATAALSAGLVAVVQAAAPMAKTNAPGFSRLMLGNFEITALSDGTVALPVDQLLTNTTPEKVNQALARSYLTSPLRTSVNGYLINTGTRLVLVDTELVPGIRAIASHGHTPGHIVYAVENQGQTLMPWGDPMHVAAVQFAAPATTIQFDTDSKAAAVQRQKAHAEAAKRGYLVGASHLSFPGLGRLRAEKGGGYRFIPVNHEPLN